MNPGYVQISFQSDPSVNLNNSMIAANIASRYTYDRTTGTYSFDNSGFTIQATATVPSGYSGDLQVATQYGGSANATIIPSGSSSG